MEWRELDVIQDHTKVKDQLGLEKVGYRLQFRNYQKADSQYYPEETVKNTEAKEEYWERWRAQNNVKRKGNASTIQKNSEPSNPAHHQSPARHPHGSTGNTPGGATRKVTFVRVIEELSAADDAAQNVSLVDQSEGSDTETEEDSIEDEASPTSASSILGSRNPNNDSEVADSHLRNVDAVVRLPLEVVEQSVLRLTLCPNCSTHFSSELHSKHCPYMSRGCGHSVCAACVFKMKGRPEEQDEQTGEWWTSCPIAECGAERSFSASRPPGANLQLLTVIAGMSRLLDRRKEDEV